MQRVNLKIKSAIVIFAITSTILEICITFVAVCLRSVAQMLQQHSSALQLCINVEVGGFVGNACPCVDRLGYIAALGH